MATVRSLLVLAHDHKQYVEWLVREYEACRLSQEECGRAVYATGQHNLMGFRGVVVALDGCHYNDNAHACYTECLRRGIPVVNPEKLFEPTLL